jgi:hypothetical protein
MKDGVVDGPGPQGLMAELQLGLGIGGVRHDGVRSMAMAGAAGSKR